MVKQSALALVLALALAGCGHTSGPTAPREKPRDLIPDAAFTALLLEMHAIEGARGGEHLMGDSIPVWKVYAGTFAHFGYSQEQVERSYAYYHADPKGMVLRYDAIIDSLRARSQQLSKPIEP